MCQSSWESSCLWDPETLGSYVPVILGILEHLGLELLLDVVGLAAEFESKVCSGYRPRLEGTCASGQAEFLGTWVLLVQLLPVLGQMLCPPFMTSYLKFFFFVTYRVKLVLLFCT